MPRFTLRQLLVGVFVGCVYLAVLRDVFAEVRHTAVLVVAWAIFYFGCRLWLTLGAHCIPLLLLTLAALLVLLFGISDPDVRVEVWRLLVYESRAYLTFMCGVGSVLSFPMAIVGLIARH